MREIARAAGLTEGTLYHYFSSKNALIEEAFRWSAFQGSDVARAMSRDRVSLRARLHAVGEEFLAALRRNPDWTRIVIREALRAAPDGDGSPVRGALVSLARERTRALAAALRDELRANRIAPCDPRLFAEQLFHALIGRFVSESIAGASAAPRSIPDPFLDQLVDTLSRALEPGARRRPPPRSRAR
jgi:AcrR family transcriptional regulator